MQMYALYKDPKGRSIFRSPGNTTLAAATPEQSTTSSVASRRTTTKDPEEDTDVSNQCMSPSSVVQQSVCGSANDKHVAGAVLVTDGMNQVDHTLNTGTPIHDYQLSFANAYVSSPKSDDLPGMFSPENHSEL